MPSDISPAYSKISLHKIQSSDAQKLILLANEVMNQQWNENIRYWRYFQNPTGQVYGNFAELDGHAVGSYGNIPVKVKLGDELLTCAQAVDAMIDPNFR